MACAIAPIPWEENQVADTLAGGQLAFVQTPLVYAEQPQAALAATLAEQIARLNQAGKMSFKEAMRLRVGGSKQYSRWHLQELVRAVGTAGVTSPARRSPTRRRKRRTARETALRSHGAGLAAQLAYAASRLSLSVLANRRHRESG